jgi:hypothetical protein
MWWPFIPWLVFLVALGATFVVYRHRHQGQQRQPDAVPPSPEEADNTTRKR